VDKIDLPCIDADARLNDAIALMKNKGRSGVFVALPSGPRVLDADLILHTLREKGNLKISAVKPRLATVTLPNKRLAARASSTAKARIDVQKHMDEGRAVYAVARVVGRTAHILTRHELYGDAVRGAPTMWRCKTDPDHMWLTVDLIQPGNKCRDDGSGVDAV